MLELRGQIRYTTHGPISNIRGERSGGLNPTDFSDVDENIPTVPENLKFPHMQGYDAFFAKRSEDANAVSLLMGGGSDVR